MADEVAGDRTLATADNGGGTEERSCPYCGRQLADRSLATRSITLKATVPQHIAAALLRIRTLSPRERAAFELLGLGYDNRSLARVLGISERTAKRHVTAILAKLGLESRLQAGLAALLAASLQSRSTAGPKVPSTAALEADHTSY